MSGLQLKLLGTFEARWGETVLPVTSRKAQALIAYLAMHRGRKFGREQLATFLWSRSDPEHARASLRQTLLALRRIVPSNESAILCVEGDAVGVVDVDACDAERLGELYAAGDLEDVVALYPGDFLDGLNIPEPDFEDWMSGERRRLREFALRAMSGLIEAYRSKGAPKRAIDLALRSLSIDPLQESVHRTLMDLYADSGRHTHALDQFERCRTILRTELGVEPGPETLDLDRRIRAQRRDDHAPNVAAQRLSEAGLGSWLGWLSAAIALGMIPLAHLAVSSSQAITPAVEADAALSDDVFRIPQGPRIAVLGFTDLKNGSGEDLFANGLTHDVINALTQFREYFVFAAHTMVNFPVASSDVRKVARDLGADYIVKGSVRRDAGRVRVIASVVDGENGAQLWSETYDRDLTARNLFDIQDDLAGRVAATIGAVGGVVARDGIRSVRRKPPSNLNTLDCIYFAYNYYETGTEENHRRGQDCLVDAVKTDADNPLAWVHLSWLYQDEVILGYGTRTEGPPALDLALEAAERSVALDPRYNRAHEAMATTHFLRHDLEKFYRSANKALNLNPNDSDSLAALGTFMAFSGDWDTGVSLVTKASQLNPHHPPWYLYSIGKNHVREHEFDRALAVFKQMDMPDQWIYQLVMTYVNGLSGDVDAARAARDELEKLNPGVEINDAVELYRQLNFREAYITFVVDGLRAAGLPPGEMAIAD